MTNICFFNTTKFWGGGEKWHFETAAYLCEHGHQVFLIAHPHSELQKRITRTHVITFPLAVSNFSFLNLYKMQKLISFFRSRRIQTVVFNASSDVKLGAIAARIAGVKAIVYRRGIAVPVKNTWVNRLLYGRILTHLLTNSKETARALLQRLDVPQAAKRIRTIYNGIDFSHFSAPLPYGNDPKKHSNGIIIGSAGRLVAQKGHKHLIALASQLKKQNLDFRIRIAGEGPLRQSLENQIQEQGLSDVVQLLGFISDMPHFLQQIDIFVFPSLYEGFGFAIAEAMAASLPVVAFDVSSNPEVIGNGITGFLVTPIELETLTKKIMTLAKDPELRQQMGKKGLERVHQMFDRAKQLDKLETYLCQEVLIDNKI